MFEVIKPYARAVKYDLLYRWAKRKASIARIEENVPFKPPPTFIIGCGRSGTTILGKLLMKHPKIDYLFEPYHMWAAVDSRTDVLNLYENVKPRLMLNAEHVSEKTRVRFNRVFKRKAHDANPKLLVEKTPLNAMRIGYLDALAPGCRFIHIIRDGSDVCRSIAQIVSKNSYRIAGKPELNQWWGVDNVKWRTLKHDGTEADYFVNDVDQIENDQLARGAYEWLISLREVDKWRDLLGDRLLEISYEKLISQPCDTLTLICSFIGLEASLPWLEESCGLLQPQIRGLQQPVRLPTEMAHAFNNYQKKFSFVTQAEEVSDFGVETIGH